MSGRSTDMWDIREILRRVRLGESDRAISQALGVSRNTVRKYRKWAEQAALPAGELPPTGQLRVPVPSETCCKMDQQRTNARRDAP